MIKFIYGHGSAFGYSGSSCIVLKRSFVSDLFTLSEKNRILRHRKFMELGSPDKCLIMCELTKSASLKVFQHKVTK